MQIKGEITYEHQREIGAGQGMNSKVWLAHDPQLGGVIAVKEIPKANLGNNVDDYFREAETMFAVDHPNVIPIRAAWQTSDLICLGMKYFQRGSLQDRTQNGPISVKEALRVGQAVLTGLGHIHARNVIHFDIKPSNILFSDSGEPMIADFGQSRRFTPPKSVVIRPAMYVFGIPPECYHGIGIVQSDIYQVGLMLYRAVNGDPFFRAQIPATDREIESETVAGHFPSRSKFMPHVPVRLRTLIRTALGVNPADRYPSAVEFANALAGINVLMNWKVTVGPHDEIAWRAKRDGQPDLMIQLRRDGTNRWKVEKHTVTAHASPRRRDLDEWRDGMTRNQAIDYLKTLFGGME